MNSDNGKTISLVLGSGGARGMAHIGIIYWLEEHDFRIKSISGCSMGALVGGVYATGKLKEFDAWLKTIDRKEIFSLMDISFSSGGLIKGERVLKSIMDFVEDRPIESLPIKFTAVATDIHGEKEVWLNSGSLFSAIRASISLPLLFTPVEYKGSYLIDGGVLNPVPIAPTFSDTTDLTIAVNLGGSRQSDSGRKKVMTSTDEDIKEKDDDEKPGFFDRFKKKSDGEPEEEEMGLLDVANQSFDSMQGTIARLKLAAYQPDEIVEISKNACGVMEFDRAEELIKLGYEAAEDSLSHLLKEINTNN